MMHTAGKTLRSLALTLLLAAAAPALGQRLAWMYELIELGSESGGDTRAYAVNNTGQIVGWVEHESGRHAAHWHNRVTTDLHGMVHFELQHPYPLYTESHAEAYDISDGDQAVGTARTTVDCNGVKITLTQAYVLRPAVLTDLATPYPGDALTNLGTLGNPCGSAYDSAATGVSNGNHIVGWADVPGPSIHAFLVVPQNGEIYRDDNLDLVNDLMIDLGTLHPDADPVSSATAVNDAGQVTGYSYTVVGERSAYHAFVWQDDVMTDLGTLGGPNSWGRAINNDGMIAGESDAQVTISDQVFQYTHAFVYDPDSGNMIDLGTLRDDPRVGSSSASGINDDGVVVGWAENENRERRAVLYDPAEGTLQDLNDLLYLFREDGSSISPGIVLTEARDINNGGVIVGWGSVRGTDNTRAFLLNPKLVDLDELEALLEQTGGNDDPDTGGTAGGDGDDDPDVEGDPEFGPPDHLTPTPATGGDTDVITEPTGAAGWSGLCGGGALAAIPLTLLGLGCLKVSQRRRG